MVLQHSTHNHKPRGSVSLWARAIAEILAMACGLIGSTYHFLVLFFYLLNRQLRKKVDSTQITPGSLKRRESRKTGHL